MISFLVFLVLCTGALVDGNTYSYSTSVGSGIGTSFSLSSDGGSRIDAIRVYEVANAYITGIQIRFGGIWSQLAGRKVGTALEIELYPNEFINQISGKYHSSNYIYRLTFSLSSGRTFGAGQPIQTSFNMYPRHQGEQLILLSGRYNTAGITAIAAHWGTPGMNYGNTTGSS